MALQPAILGTARLNGFRLAYLPADLQRVRDWRLGFWLDGVLVRQRVRVGSVEIRDILNDAPNTASWRMDGTPPPEPGMEVRITINSNAPRLLFNGTLETTAITYEGKPAPLNVVYACSATDDTMRADRRRPFALYQAVSATTVATDLVRQFAPGLTANHVQADLPPVTVAFDGTEGFNGCLRAVTKIIGGYFYWEDGDLHLFLEEATNAPDPLTDTTRSLYLDPPIASTSDDSQLRTRVYGRGFGTALLSDVLVTETILPITDATLFTPGGGLAIASTTADGSPTERLAYTGVQLGGAGTVVGPGVSPSVAPSLALAAPSGTSGIGAGTRNWAYTFVTAAGESLPSPVAIGTTPGPSFLAPSVVGPGSLGRNPGGSLTNGTYQYAFTWVTATGETTGSTITSHVMVGAPANATIILSFPTNPAGTTTKVYRTVVNGSQLKLVASIGTSVTYNDGLADASLGANIPTVNTAATYTDRVDISGVAVGPSGTTSRKIYRTVNGGAQLKLQQTIANNTATTGVTDSTLDASLGANAPTLDTSGLTVPATGQVIAGSTSMLTAGTGALPAAGWIITPARDLVRYTGFSGNTLTGIPASGPGAILTTLFYGDPVVPAPALTGVQFLVRPLLKGAAVHIFVQRDDLAAQAAAAARESTATYTADGIHEHLLTDERRAEPSLTALCDADLQLFAYPIVTVAYVSHDIQTKSGKPIVVALTTPAIDETLTIQEVTITQLDIAPGVPARFATTASSVKFRLEDLLRRLSALLPD